MLYNVSHASCEREHHGADTTGKGEGQYLSASSAQNTQLTFNEDNREGAVLAAPLAQINEKWLFDDHTFFVWGPNMVNLHLAEAVHISHYILPFVTILQRFSCHCFVA